MNKLLKKVTTFLGENFYRIITYEIFLFILFVFLIKNTEQDNFNKKEILQILISIVSIIVAIIVTYLFSKLFAEKTIRVERKKEIDELSLKITYLRRIAFHIKGLHEFWKFKENVNVKSAIDYKYPNLTYEEYRQYDIPGIKKFTYDEWVVINKEIFETSGQAYLALKGLQDGINDFSFYLEINPINYSLDDITRYKEYASSFWYLLDRSDDSIVNFNGINEYWLRNVDELYFKIMGKQIDQKNYKSNIKDMFSEFDSVIFEKHYYLNSLNKDTFPVSFKNSFINMLIFVVILLASLVLYVVNIDHSKSLIITILLLSVFISNTIDLVLLTMNSIKEELNIKEIFKI